MTILKSRDISGFVPAGEQMEMEQVESDEAVAPTSGQTVVLQNDPNDGVDFEKAQEWTDSDDVDTTV